jgi:phthalate 3,4-dioxygenase ferredoxin reductase component
MPTTVIVGGSVAGTRVASDLRRLGYAGEVKLVDSQHELPYDRPPLSKDMLTSAEESPHLLLSAEQADDRQIDLRLGVRAESLDVAGSAVILANGTVERYDTLVIATGARPRPTPWPLSERVLELRTLADGRRLRDALRVSRKIVVVGAGFIGAEVASAARTMGLDVVIVDPVTVPMSRLFGEVIGERFTQLHNAHGVTTQFGVGVAAIDVTSDGVAVDLTNGSTLRADLVVVGIGVQPNDSWLGSSGLALDNGVLCDSRCRAEGRPDIFVAGDVARWHHPRYGEAVRVEHWTNAVEQAQFVARAIADPAIDAEFAPVSYVWSDQYDWKIQIAGRPERGTEHRVVSNVDRSQFAAVYTDAQGFLSGALTVNWPRAAVLSRRALANDESLAQLWSQLEALPR